MARNLLSNLSPDGGTMVGLLTAAGVYLIYQNALPDATSIRAGGQPNDVDVTAARKQASYLSVGLVALTFLVARDLNSYIISGAALVGIDLMYKHANMTNPLTGKLDTSSSGATIAPGLSSLPDDGYDDANVA